MTLESFQNTPVETITTEQIPALWAAIRDLLEEKRERINEEIVNYPPPIPACDQYFNHLLQERATIPQALNHLGAIFGTASTQEEQITQLEAFIETSSHLTDEEIRHIQRSIVPQ